MTVAGASPVINMKKFPKRFRMLHIKDFSSITEPTTQLGDPNRPKEQNQAKALSTMLQSSRRHACLELNIVSRKRKGYTRFHNSKWQRSTTITGNAECFIQITIRKWAYARRYENSAGH